MGGRRRSALKPIPKKRPKLDRVFKCPRCSHEDAASVILDKKNGTAVIQCKVCRASHKYREPNITYLTAPVDVYSDWIDAIDEGDDNEVVEEEEEDEYYDEEEEDGAVMVSSSSSSSQSRAKSILKSSVSKEEEEELLNQSVRGNGGGDSSQPSSAEATSKKRKAVDSGEE